MGLILSIVIGISGYLFYNYVDCDLVTFVCHYYRVNYKKKSLKNQSIWIIGASSGIGENIAFECAKEGAGCIILSARREEQLKRVQSKCNEINSKCKIIIKTFDMIQLASNRDTCQQYIRDVISSNDIPNNDINYLIINAGITQRSLGLETELSVLNYLFQANTLSVASLIQSYVAVIRERKKKILEI